MEMKRLAAIKAPLKGLREKNLKPDNFKLVHIHSQILVSG